MNTLKQVASGGLGIFALPGWVASTADISLLIPSRKGLAPAVRALSDFLVRELPTAVRG